MARVYKKKIKVDNQEFLVTINKTYSYTSGGIDNYTYWCRLYREIKFLGFTINKWEYTFKGDSTNYLYYSKDLDRLIDRTIERYKENERYNSKVTSHEQTFVSKYEVGGNK